MNEKKKIRDKIRKKKIYDKIIKEGLFRFLHSYQGLNFSPWETPKVIE